MLKRYVILVLLSLQVFLQTICFAGEGPVLFSTGFRNIAWGTHKNDLPDMGLSKKALGEIYASGESSAMFMEGVGNLEMKFKSIPLLSIFLRFNNAEFYAVDMVFQSQYHEKIRDIFMFEFGAPSKKSAAEQEWVFEHVTVRLTDREILVVSS